MNTSQSLDSALLHVAIKFPQVVAVVADRVRGLIARSKRQRQVRATYAALQELDSRTLRDLGFHRSEIYSVAAELAGVAQPTRRSRS